MKNKQRRLIAVLLAIALISVITLLLVSRGGSETEMLSDLSAEPTTSNNSGTSSLESVNGISTDGTYTNIRFNYQINIPEGWRISASLSKKMDESIFSQSRLSDYYCGSKGVSEEGGDTYSIDKDCVKNNSDLSSNVSVNKKYLDEWKIEESHSVVITRLTEQEESNFTIDEYSIYGYKAPEGSVIAVMTHSNLATASSSFYLATAISTTEKNEVSERINYVSVRANTSNNSNENEVISNIIKTFKILE